MKVALFFSLLVLGVLFERSSAAMDVGDNAKKMIQEFEGWRNCTYLNPANLSAIGWGHLIDYETEKTLYDSCISHSPTGLELFQKDIAIAQNCLNAEIHNITLNCNQFGALASLVYNIGCENFKSSTLLKKLNAGNFELRKEFLRWSISGGEITEGLFKRREKEADFFEKSSNDSNC